MTTARVLLALVISVLAAACSDDGGPPAHADASADADGGTRDGAAASGPAQGALRSGKRLHPRFQVERGASDDAEGVFIGWHDDELDTDCRFVHDVDGVYRCLPSESSGLRVFPTSDCAPGAGAVSSFEPDEDCSPRYVWYGFEATGCNEQTAGVTLRITGPSSANKDTHPYVMSVFGACNPRHFPPPGDPGPTSTYCEVEEADSEQFVTASERIRDAGDVRELLLMGDDGSVEPHALLHPDFDTPLMRDSWAGDGLVPTSTRWGEVPVAYADAACSKPALCFPDETPTSVGDPVVTAPAECAPTVLIDRDECSGAAYELGKPVNDVNWCDQSAPEGPLVCYARERELPAIPYTEIALGSGRLRPLWITREDKPIFTTGFFLDAQFDVPCLPGEVDGDMRCDPWDPVRELSMAIPGSTSGWVHQFSDDACKNSIGFAYRSKCGAAAPGVARFFPDLMRMRSIGKPEVSKTYSGLGPPNGPVYMCMPEPDLPGELFEAEPIDTSELAEVVEVVR